MATEGAPLSTTFTPGAGFWVATVLAAKPLTGPWTRQAKPGVLEDALGEDVGLAPDVRDDEDLGLWPRRRRLEPSSSGVAGPPAANVQLAAASSQITTSATRRGSEHAQARRHGLPIGRRPGKVKPLTGRRTVV